MNDKCEKCGTILVLASTSVFGMRVEPDEEPYENGKVEPVIVNNHPVDEIEANGFSATCHACPECGWFKDFDVTSVGE